METGLMPSFPAEWKHLETTFRKFFAFRTGAVPWCEMSPLEQRVFPFMAQMWDLTEMRVAAALLKKPSL